MSDDRPPQQVEDPGEYNQRLRLQELSQARKNASVSLGGEAAEVYGDRWETFALRQVKTFAKELEWLIRNEGGDEYFTKELGPITLGPPSLEGDRVLGSRPREKSFSVSGLFSTAGTGLGFVDLPAVVSHTWIINVDKQHQGPQQVQTTLETSVPISVSRNADSLCRKFINESGLDARLEEDKPHIKL
ncbi:hypothetical protein GJR96_00650 [Haloferax sp. MBLA0076]|uniref:Uncharacterized protein n=1 Tax=Haloferax litoreum TaxID=2666140 RepID=A0A6A8GBJ0_9EURY|nr:MULTISPECIES: hypothetical protein [Haloferax]KAB1192026.1 hypothetical protein Hfx1148_00650 [Haloferax sp. CBA1148]MRX20468.1 hypothetical protein [Haloferax litoreum]